MSIILIKSTAYQLKTYQLKRSDTFIEVKIIYEPVRPLLTNQVSHLTM